MDKINTPFELEKLADTLRGWEALDDRVSVEYYKLHKPKMGFWERISTPGNPLFVESTPERLEARNTARFKAYPNEVEVSPEIASFLYAVDQESSTKNKEFLERHGTGAMLFARGALGVPLRAVLAALFPVTAPDATDKIAKTFVDMVSYKRALTKLIEERQKLVEPILGNYRLSETSPGKYALKLQKIEESSYSMSTGRSHVTYYTKVVPEAGIDPNLDPKNLPPLPSISRDGP